MCWCDNNLNKNQVSRRRLSTGCYDGKCVKKIRPRFKILGSSQVKRKQLDSLCIKLIPFGRGNARMEPEEEKDQGWNELERE